MTNFSLRDKVKIVRLYSISSSHAEVRRQLFEEGFSSGKFKRQWGIDRTKGLLSVGAIRIINKTFDKTGMSTDFY